MDHAPHARFHMRTAATDWDGTLRIAGIRICVRVRGINERQIEARYGNFVAPRSSEPADLSLMLDVDVRHRQLPQPDGTGRAACIGLIGTDGSIRYRRCGLWLRFDPARGEASGLAAPLLATPDPARDARALDTPLRLLISYFLASHGGFLLHASGFGDARGAIAFVGVSGSGKTTTAHKLVHENVLSDEQLAVLRVGRDWFAHATPFMSNYARQPVMQVCALRRVLVLSKGTDGAILRPVHPAHAIARMLRCVQWFVPGAEPLRELLGMVSDLVGCTPVFELEIGREAPVLPTIDELLKSFAPS